MAGTPMLAQDLLCCTKSLKYPVSHILFDRACHCVWMSQVSNRLNQAINKHVYDNQCTPALCALQWTNKLQMEGSCWWNSACLCVLWSYNKQWSNGIIMSYISFIHTSPRHTDLRQLQGRRDKKRHEPSIVMVSKSVGNLKPFPKVPPLTSQQGP